MSLMMLSLNVLDSACDFISIWIESTKTKKKSYSQCAISQVNLSKWELQRTSAWKIPHVYDCRLQGTQDDSSPLSLSYQVRLCLRAFFRFRAPWPNIIYLDWILDLSLCNYGSGRMIKKSLKLIPLRWVLKGPNILFLDISSLDWHPEVDSWSLSTVRVWFCHLQYSCHFCSPWRFDILIDVASIFLWLLSTVQYSIIL